MDFINAIRERYIDAIRTYYRRKAEKILNVSDDELDERINLSDLIERVDAEINLAVSDLEYDIDLEEDDE